jgi:hypothetical protein
MPVDAVTQNQRTDADNLYAAPDGDGAGISQVTEAASPADAIEAIARAATRALTA